MDKMVERQASGAILVLESEAHTVKWLIRILGVLLLLLSAALVLLLVLMGQEIQAGLIELLGRGWLLLVMCVVSAALGIYLLLKAGKKQLPTKNEE